MSGQNKLAEHQRTMAYAQREGIDYGDAAGRLRAQAALADGTPRSAHFETLLRLQSKGISNQHSPDFAKRYAAELAATLEARAESKLDAQLAEVRRKRLASARSTTTPQQQRPLAQVRSITSAVPKTTPADFATFSVGGKPYRPLATKDELDKMVSVLADGMNTIEGRPPNDSRGHDFYALQLGGQPVPVGIAGELTSAVRNRDAAKFRDNARALAGSALTGSNSNEPKDAA